MTGAATLLWLKVASPLHCAKGFRCPRLGTLAPPICSSNPSHTQLPVKFEASVGLSCNQWRASESGTTSVGVLSSGSSSQVCHGLMGSSVSLLEPKAVSLPVLSPGTQSNQSLRLQLDEDKVQNYLHVSNNACTADRLCSEVWAKPEELGWGSVMFLLDTY